MTPLLARLERLTRHVVALGWVVELVPQPRKAHAAQSGCVSEIMRLLPVNETGDRNIGCVRLRQMQSALPRNAIFGQP